MNTERHSAALPIQSKCGKIWTRKTPNTDPFYVFFSVLTFVLAVSCLVPIEFGEQKGKQEYDEKNEELDEKSQNEDSDEQDQYNIYDGKNKKPDETKKSQEEDGDEQDQYDINEKLMDEGAILDDAGSFPKSNHRSCVL